MSIRTLIPLLVSCLSLTVQAQETMEHEMRTDPSKKDHLEPQITMAELMRKALEKRYKNFKKIAKGLD